MTITPTEYVLISTAWGLIGYFMGFRRGKRAGMRQYEMAQEDAILTGIGLMKGGERISPKRFFK